MSLEELTFESPQGWEGLEGRGETRFFVTTNIASAPNRGDIPGAPFSAGYVVESVRFAPHGSEGVTKSWKVIVTAVPPEYFDPEPDHGAEEEEEGIEASIEEMPLKEVDTGDLTKVVEDGAGYPKFFLMPRFIYYISKYVSATSVSGLKGELAKTGMVNEGANDPFTAAGSKKWMCIGTPMDKVGRNRWKITYKYKHAGYDKAGTELNWETIAKEEGFIIRTGTIAP